LNAQEMLNKAILIIARQDITDSNRELLLLFMNTVRRAVIRENTIRKFFDYRTMTHVSGVIDGTAQSLKFARRVEYIDGSGGITQLLRFKSLEQAREAGYTDLTETGTPKYYLDMDADILIIPVPTTGTIKVYGEFWPADLTDSPSSSDVTTVELPEAFIYLAAAEYFDFLKEADKASYWRKKGLAIVESYLKEDKKQRTYSVGANSDPLGNGGVW
jgi:hypothetical protein